MPMNQNISSGEKTRKLDTVGKTYSANDLDSRAGVWEGLVNGFHTADAPLLICNSRTILKKQHNKDTCLTY